MVMSLFMIFFDTTRKLFHERSKNAGRGVGVRVSKSMPEISKELERLGVEL